MASGFLECYPEDTMLEMHPLSTSLGSTRACFLIMRWLPTRLFSFLILLSVVYHPLSVSTRFLAGIWPLSPDRNPHLLAIAYSSVLILAAAVFTPQMCLTMEADYIMLPLPACLSKAGDGSSLRGINTIRNPLVKRQFSTMLIACFLTYRLLFQRSLPLKSLAPEGS